MKVKVEADEWMEDEPETLTECIEYLERRAYYHQWYGACLQRVLDVARRHA